MATGTPRRIQPDLLDEIENMPGDSFSEKLRAWKLKEIKQYFEKNEQNNTALTEDDIKRAVRNSLPSGAYQ